MVLKKVGESLVSISINGTEQVNELISDDTSYDISVSSSVATIDVLSEIYPNNYQGDNSYTVYDASKSSADVTQFVISGNINIVNSANITRDYDYTLSLGGTVLVSESGTQRDNSSHSVSISETVLAPSNSTLTLDASGSNYYIQHDVNVDLTTSYKANSSVSVDGVTKL